MVLLWSATTNWPKKKFSFNYDEYLLIRRTSYSENNFKFIWGNEFASENISTYAHSFRIREANSAKNSSGFSLRDDTYPPIGTKTVE